MKVAALQMTSGADVQANLNEARSLLQEAHAAEAALAVLPENFAFMGMHDADKLAVGETDGGGPIQDFLAETAQRLGLWIIAGTIPLRVPGDARVAAASLVYDAEGKRAGRYDKIHLFDVEIPERAESYRESANMAPGKTPTGGRHTGGSRRPCGVLRRALSGALSELERSRRGAFRAAVSLYGADGARALGDALARARH